MIQECLLILHSRRILVVVCDVGDSKLEFLQSLIMKGTSTLPLMIEVGNVVGVQWPGTRPPIPGWRNSDTKTVFIVEFILGWSRISDIIWKIKVRKIFPSSNLVIEIMNPALFQIC